MKTTRYYKDWYATMTQQTKYVSTRTKSISSQIQQNNPAVRCSIEGEGVYGWGSWVPEPSFSWSDRTHVHRARVCTMGTSWTVGIRCPTHPMVTRWNLSWTEGNGGYGKHLRGIGSRPSGHYRTRGEHAGFSGRQVMSEFRRVRFAVGVRIVHGATRDRNCGTVVRQRANAWQRKEKIRVQ